jgi:hypothetical protein
VDASENEDNDDEEEMVGDRVEGTKKRKGRPTKSAMSDDDEEEEENDKEQEDEDHEENGKDDDEEDAGKEVEETYWDGVDPKEYTHQGGHLAGTFAMLCEFSFNGHFAIGPGESSGLQQEKE